MRLELKNIKYYFLTCKNPTRKNHMLEEFKECDLTAVEPVMGIHKLCSGATGHSRMFDLGVKNQDKTKPFQPFVVFEDDVKKYRKFPEYLDIPDDADILYVGISTWGMDLKKSKTGINGLIYNKNVNNDLIRVYNMLSTHGYVICSIRGLLSYQKCLLEDFNRKRGWDMSMAEIQPYLNVYALREPLVYQYGKLGGEELYTKIDFKNLKTLEIPKNSINKINLSVITNL